MPERTRSGSEPAGEPGGSDDRLDDVAETATVGDLVDLDSFERDLPGGWTVVAEVVPFEDEPLVEVLLLRRGPWDPKLLVKPVELSPPDGRVECYERRVGGRRERIMTTDSLAAAVRAATNWANQRTG